MARYFVPACLMPHLLVISMVAGLLSPGPWLLVPFLLLIAVAPLLDLLVRVDDLTVPDEETIGRIKIQILYYSPHAYLVAYLIVLFGSMSILEELSVVDIIMLTCSLSAIGVIAYAAAHEVLHKKGKAGQLLQFIITLMLGYPHYKMVHLHGHHKRAATPEDKNTAWQDESFYQYLFRSGFQSTRFCYEHEQQRVKRSGNTLASNKMIWFFVSYLSVLLLILFVFGWVGLGVYISHIVGAYVLLEAVNYIQHYGLLRSTTEGKVEKLQSYHSWDMCQIFTSFMIFRSGLHSHHHLKANVPYYLLKAERDSPKLPVCYPIAIALVFVPVVWRWMISKRLQQYNLALN